MQTVSLSVFRFDGVGDRAWAFTRMQYARAPMAALPGIGFWKLFGTGSGESFHPLPNFGVYAVLACWPGLDHAREQVQSAEILRRYRGHAADHWTVFLRPVHSAGRWDGQAPFEAEPTETRPRPLAVLTRATLRGWSLPAFWRRVPAISAMTAGCDGLRFKLGMGEVPWVHQVTVSIWDDTEAMRRFAYKSGYHKEAIRAARRNRWFKEELFARFAIQDSWGAWQGGDPLAPVRPQARSAA